MTSGERRKHPRLSIQGATVRNSLLVGRVLNMSLGGLAIETTTALRIGGSYSFRAEIHEHSLEIEAQIRWCRLARTLRTGDDEVRAIFRAGVCFARPLLLFSEDGLQNSEAWFDPEVRVSR